MPRRATKPFNDRLLVAPRILAAINQVLIEPGDEPVTELELLQAYYSVDMGRFKKEKKLEQRAHHSNGNAGGAESERGEVLSGQSREQAHVLHLIGHRG